MRIQLLRAVPMAVGLLLPSTDALAQGKLITLEQTAGRSEDRVSLRGSTPSWKWAEDDVHLVEGSGEEAQWVDITTWERSVPPAVDEDAPSERELEREAAREAFMAVAGVDEKLAKKIASGRRGSNEDGTAFLHQASGALWFRRDGAGARRLTEPEAGFELEKLSRDGRYVAFVRDNDLYVVSTDDAVQRRITSNGSEERFNGKLDWVYQEEVYGRGNFKGFWWSPDSKHVAFLSLDESPVHEFTVIDHIEKGHFRVKPEVSNYPKAGDPNPIVSLGVAAADTGEVTWIDLSGYESFEPLIVRVGWSPDGARVIFQVQDRIQTWLHVDAADPLTGELTTLIHEQSDSWVNVLGSPRWLDDGTFLWESERTGYRHVYHYQPDGTLIRPVTSGPWAVARVRDVDEQTGQLWFSGKREGAADSNEYRVNLDGANLVHLTPGGGSHSIVFNDARTHFIDTYSSLAAPTRVRLCDSEGNEVRELGQAEIPHLEEYATSSWELHRIEARDGFPLDVAVLKPVPFDPNVAHPVWLPTYSGPDAPSVRNRWNSSSWSQFLAQRGVVVFQVNVRTASAEGRVVSGAGYKQLLIPELRDLEDAVAWLTAHPWADASRVGITGYSYGGSMSAFALTHSDRFALGIAGGGVYDWGMYDTIYTERYMSTPQLNPEGYEQTSVIKAAENLQGHLLLHCGAMDDNVHMQNTLQLTYALQKAGVSFDLMIYPQSRHGVGDPDQRWHLRQMEWDTIREVLGVSDPVAAAPAGTR